MVWIWVGIIGGLALFSLPAEGGRRRKPRSPAAAVVNQGAIQDALQRVVFYEDRRISPASILVHYLSHPSPRLKKAALLALGRIGDSSGLDEMAAILTKKDVDLRIEAAFALSLIPNETAAKILSQNFPMHKDPQTRAALLENVGRSGGEGTVKWLAQVLQSENDPRLAPAIFESLGLLWSRDSESWSVPGGLLATLAQGAQSKGPDAVLAAFALARFKGNPSLLPADECIAAAQNASSEFSRAFLMRVLGKIRTPPAQAILLKGATNLVSVPLRVEAVKGLALQEPSEELITTLGSALADPSQHVVSEALSALGKHGPKASKASTPVLSLWNTSRSPWIKGIALKTLAAIDPKTARTEITRTLTNPGSPNLPEAAVALGTIAEAPDVGTLTALLDHPQLPVVVAAAEALSLIEDSLLTPEARTALLKTLERKDANLTTVVAQTAAQRQWKDSVGPLVAAYGKLKQVEHLEAKAAVLGALGLLGDSAAVPVVEKAVGDREKLVVEAAVKALKNLTGKNLSDRIPLNSKVDSPTPSLNALRLAVDTRVVLKTVRGEIHLRLLPEAPMTALNFVSLVRKGTYHGLTFHRVVPNFVVQGGDPRGDGFGGPGYLIRDECSRRRHERGTVGIATAGKDTGGSQFFINLAPNHHLNGRYTVFAEVTQGMAVADKLEGGDKILSASAY